MAAGDLLKLVVSQTLQESTVQNVLYYKVVTDDPGGSNLSNLNTDFNTVIITGLWQALVSSELQFECNSVQKVFPTPEEALQEFPTSFIGGKSGQSLPAMSSVLMQKRNNTLAGVGKKGRIYIAGLPELDTSKGRVNVGDLAAWSVLAGAFGNELAESGSGVYKPAWAIRKPDAPNKGSITGSVEIDVVQLLPRIATQRRRRTPIRTFSPP